jgi:aldehyde:ferredoxin oxidoreductase
MPDYGYAGQVLKIDISDGKVEKQASKGYTDKYMGGHGLAARLYWELVSPQAKTTDPENCLICASGPVTGFPGFAGFRWKICGKTNLNSPESFSYCNLGDRWGAMLKYAGYDALAVQGKADKPVYIYIDNGRIEIRDASQLWGQDTFEASDSLKTELGKGVSILTIGPAAENLIPFSTVLAEGGASGSGGLGTIMGSKYLKAIVVAGDKRPQAAQPERVRELAEIIRVNRAKTDRPGFSNVPGLTHIRPCYGCGAGCYREMYADEKGRQYKSLCQAGDMYTAQSVRYSGKKDGARLLATRLCDGYGLDASVMQSMIEFINACYLEGVLTEKETGLPLSKIGSPEFIEELTAQIAFKKGFGEVLSHGTIAAAGLIGQRAVEMLPGFVATRGGEKKDYDPRILLITALSYATEPRRPIQQLHEVVLTVAACLGGPGGSPPTISVRDFRHFAEKNWGSAIAADFSTWEGKALAAKKIQDRVYAKESLVICDLRWTVSEVQRVLGTTPDTVTEAQIFSAITGKETNDLEIDKYGERVFNLQRAILTRQGWQGRQSDSLLDYFFTVPLKKGEVFFNPDGIMPGKNGEFVSRIGCVVDKNEFENLKTEYYAHRGWDVRSGLLTRAKLADLGMQDVADDLAGRGLLRDK